MSHLLDEILAEAANGSPIDAALSSESVAVLLFASGFIDQRFNWLDREYDPLDEVTDADWDAIEKLVANLYDEVMTPMPPAEYPEQFLIWPPMAKSIAGGALSITNLTNMIPLYTAMYVTPALNNRIQFPCFMRSGVYDITVHGLRTTSAAKVQIFTDENFSPITEVDMYGTVAYNIDWLFGSVPFSNSGNHTLDFKAYAKHASSTGYGMWFTWIRGIRTADYP